MLLIIQDSKIVATANEGYAPTAADQDVISAPADFDVSRSSEYVYDPEMHTVSLPVAPAKIPLTIELSGASLIDVPGRYHATLGTEIVATVRTVLSGSFFVPVEMDGGPTTPRFVSIADGVGTVKWTPSAIGFYRIREETINRDLPTEAHLAFAGLTIVIH